MYVIIAPIQIKDGHKDEFIEALLEDARGSVNDEPGCLRFDVIQDSLPTPTACGCMKSTWTRRPSRRIRRRPISSNGEIRLPIGATRDSPAPAGAATTYGQRTVNGSNSSAPRMKRFRRVVSGIPPDEKSNIAKCSKYWANGQRHRQNADG